MFETCERHSRLPRDAVAERDAAILIKQMAIARSATAVVTGLWHRSPF